MRTLVVSFLLVLSLITCRHVHAIQTLGKYDFGAHTEATVRKRQEEPIQYPAYVTPLPLFEDKLVLRRELRELYRDQDAWTLYILALNWVAYTPQDNQFSFYQLAAIHGSPGATWGGVDAIPGGETIGYCNHISVLFPTWHRPYMALYEQTLYSVAQFIATLFPEDELEHWDKVARQFRAPYWDWARVTEEGKNVFPDDFAGQRNITASGPNGFQEIANPLYSYNFQPFNASIFPASPWSTWPETKRAPQPMVDKDAVSNNSFVARTFEIGVETYQPRLYTLLAHYDNYSAFSNEGWIPEGSNYTQDSVESLHDSIHVAAGGYFGHMAIIGYSAFEPFFWLHHMNLDRIAAMWQILHPNSFIMPTPAVYATHTSKVGDIQDSTTDLTPFRRNATSFWTSDAARDHQIFGYTYKEVVDRNHDQTASWVNKLYTAYTPASMDTSKHIHSATSGNNRGDEDVRVSPQALHSGITHKQVYRGQIYTDWLANVRADKSAYECSYTVYLFWDEVPNDTFAWPIATNLIGTHSILGMQDPNAGNRSSRLISGTIPLTAAILRRISQGHIRSLHFEDAETYMASRLKHAVALVNGTVVTSDQRHQNRHRPFLSTDNAQFAGSDTKCAEIDEWRRQVPEKSLGLLRELCL